MKFDTPAGQNPIDQLKVVGKPTDRIDGKYKTTGTAPYAYERHDVVANQAYGYVLGAGIAKGRVRAIDTAAAKASPGVLAIVTTLDMPALERGLMNAAYLFGGDADPALPPGHRRGGGRDLRAGPGRGLPRPGRLRPRGRPVRPRGRGDVRQAGPGDSGEGSGGDGEERVGDFEGAFAQAPVTLDETYTTPDESHAMMEPHATIAAWEGDKLTLWTSNQMIAWAKGSIAKILGIPKANVRRRLALCRRRLRRQAVRARRRGAGGARRQGGRAAGEGRADPPAHRQQHHAPAGHDPARPHRRDARTATITAIAHESTSGNLPDGKPETAVDQTKLLYAGANRLTAMKLAHLDLPEGNAMRAPGEAPGLMALEIAMDEMAEKLGIDPVAFRIRNDTQVDPGQPERPFSHRDLVGCLKLGAEKFGWSARNPKPGQVRDGHWLVGIGMAAGFRNNLLMKSGARVRLDATASSRSRPT